jgi:hypothetical protein
VIDRIKAFREPATTVAIIVVLVGIAATSGHLAAEAHTNPLAQVLRGVTGLYGLVDGLVLTALALACVLVTPRTRHASQLTLAATLLLWLGAVAGLVFLVISLLAAGESSLSRVLDSIGGLTDVALRGLMGYVLLLAHRVADAPAVEETRTTPAPVVEESPKDTPTSRPIWQANEAAGVVWRSASDAASGAAAGTYSSSGGSWDVPQEAAELPPLRQAVSDEPISPRIRRTHPAPAAAPTWDPAADVTQREPETRESDGNSSR